MNRKLPTDSFSARTALRPEFLVLLLAAVCSVCMPADSTGAQPDIGASGERAAIRRIGPDPASGSCRAVIVPFGASLLHSEQIFPGAPTGPDAGADAVSVQIGQVVDRLAECLQANESGLDALVKLNVYAKDPATCVRFGQVLAARLRPGTFPAVSYVTGALPRPQTWVAVDAIAVAPTRARTDAGPIARQGSKPVVRTAVLHPGRVAFVAGQAEPGSLTEATRKTLQSLRVTLRHLRMDLDSIVQIKAFLAPMTGAGAATKEIAAFFESHNRPVPPLVLVEWISPLPIEIELIAAGPALPAPSEAITYFTPPQMTASPVFSRVAIANRGAKIYTSGFYSAESGNAEEQTDSIFRQLQGALREAGTDMEHLLKATYYASDSASSTALNVIRPKYYNPARPPSASKAIVPGVGRAGRTLTLDMIAIAP